MAEWELRCPSYYPRNHVLESLSFPFTNVDPFPSVFPFSSPYWNLRLNAQGSKRRDSLKNLHERPTRNTPRLPDSSINAYLCVLCLYLQIAVEQMNTGTGAISAAERRRADLEAKRAKLAALKKSREERSKNVSKIDRISSVYPSPYMSRADIAPTTDDSR